MLAAQLLALHVAGHGGRLRASGGTILRDLPAAREAEAPVPSDEGGWAAWLADFVRRELFGDEARTLLLVVGEQRAIDKSLDRFVNEFEPSLKDLTDGAAQSVRFVTRGGSKRLAVNTRIVLGVVESEKAQSSSRDGAEESKLLCVAVPRV